MLFRTKNTFYLRISESQAIPLYLYLDERHVQWMSEAVLQHVLADLRPHVIPKLQDHELRKQEPTVDTHRGDGYQFCYFTRQVEPHSLLIKSRSHTVSQPPALAKKVQKRMPSESPSMDSRRSAKRPRTSAYTVEDDDDYDDSSPQAGESALDEEEQEEKPKPKLRLTYRGIPMNVSLCVVVEPWPPSSKHHTQAPHNSRQQTPLFLPEDHQEPEEGMMLFSQVLSTMEYGTNIAGPSAGRDDDFEGAVLFADADEHRSL